MRRWHYRIRVIWHSDTRAVETLLAFAALYWCLILFSKGETFESSPSFHAMSALASEEVWGAGAGVMFLLPLVGLLTKSLRLRRWAIFLHGAWWGFISVMFFQSAPIGTGWGIYGLFAVFALWCSWRLGQRYPAWH